MTIIEPQSEVSIGAAISPQPKGRDRSWMVRDRVLTLALQVLVLVVILGSWQLLVDGHALNSLFVSKPTSIGKALYNLLVHGDLAHQLWISVYETLVGFAISAVLGGLTALVFFEVRLIERAFSPFVTAANNLPRLALSPLFVLWFGIGSEARIALVITLAYFVVLISTYAGLQNVNRDHLLLARTLGASRRQTFLTYVLPSALPTIFAGLQLALTYSFLGAVIGEMLSGGSGLGAQIATYQATYSMDKVFADIVLMAVVATFLSLLMRYLERRILRWRVYEMRGTGHS